MRPIRFAVLLVIVVASATAAVGDVAGDVPGRDLDYRDGDTSLRGYVARPTIQADSAAGVIVVPEWWGLNDYARRRARELAAAGYVALAIDMYGEGKTTTDAKEAATLAKPWRDDRLAMRRRATAGLAALRALPGVDRKRIAAIGFCFGGTTVLELARSGADLAGVVSLHGGLATPMPATAGAIRTPILVLHGGADPFVVSSELAAFIDEMNAAKARWRLEAYGGAVHAFTNPGAGSDPTKGMAYDADAETRAIAATGAFLHEVLVAPAAK